MHGLMKGRRNGKKERLLMVSLHPRNLQWPVVSNFMAILLI